MTGRDSLNGGLTRAGNNVTRMTRTLTLAATVSLAALALSGCSAPAEASNGGPADEITLGYFANVTHAPALVGLEKGFIEESLGDTELKTEVFNAGPAAIEALSAGAIDATFIGPSPAINTFIKSGGESAVVVAGATTGGAALVVRDGIDSAADLEGATLASPQLGNTQDVALRAWLAGEGFKTSTTGEGDVTISPTENADTLTLFKSGDLDGAWLPEPWVSRLVIEGGAHVLVDEATLWPEGVFPTTVLLVNKQFLAEHPETVTALLEAHVESVNWLNENEADAASVINAVIEADTGKPVPADVIESALGSVVFSLDPAADTFPVLVEHAVEAGTGTDGELDGLFDLTLLNTILDEAGAEPVSADGLGKE